MARVIHSPKSLETSRIRAARSSPSWSKKASTVCLSRPSAAQTSRPAVVVDDDGDVALPFAEGELVDPDPRQPFERVALAQPLVGDDPLDDPADRAAS